MPKFKFTEGGKTYSVTANSADEAAPMIDDVVKHLRSQFMPSDPMAGEGAAQASAAGQMLPMLKEGIDKFTPIGSVKEIAGQLSGSRPSSSLSAGLAGADIAGTLLMPWARPVGAAYPGLKAVGKSLLTDLGIGATAGATSEGAQMAGLPAPLAIPLGIGAGIATGRKVAPEMALKPVPQGQEAQALARTAAKMGLPIPPPVGTRPRDVMGAFEQGRSTLGKQVGAAKESALQTTATPEDIIANIRKAVGGSMEATGVPVIEGALNPRFAPDPAGADLLVEKIGILSSIPPSATGTETLTLANNVLEGTKKSIAESKKLGTGLAGRTSKEGTSAWQKAIDELGDKEKVAVARSLDAAYSKLMSLGKMVSKSSETKTGLTPSFSPREFVYAWERMKPADRARFTADEIAMMDSLVTQRPDLIRKGLQKATEIIKSTGLKELSWHPTARFYEPAARKLPPRAGGAAAVSTLRPQFTQALYNQENEK